jgi:hypothetical protein
MAFPPRNDGKACWVATVLQYLADTAHWQPLTALFGNGTVAITLIRTNGGKPIPSGYIPFTGNVLAFHRLSGDKFTVTYTVDATAKQLIIP